MAVDSKQNGCDEEGGECQNDRDISPSRFLLQKRVVVGNIELSLSYS